LQFNVDKKDINHAIDTIIISAVRRFRVTRNSSNEILDSRKLLGLDTQIRVMNYPNSGNELPEIRVMKYSGSKRK